MSEYNIQMNKYNALNAEYDQLYPNPMKHANTHAKDGSDPITPASIGAYTKTEADALLANKSSWSKNKIDGSVLDWAASQNIPTSGYTGPDNTDVPNSTHWLVNVLMSNVDSNWKVVVLHGITNNQVWYNIYNYGNWNGWKQITTATDLDTKVSKSGDTMTGAYLGFNNGKGQIYVSDDANNRLFMIQSKFGNNWSGMQMEASLSGTEDPIFHIYKYVNQVLTRIGRMLHTGNAQALGFPKIAIGSYVGTGTSDPFGGTKQNSLTFDFEPKVLAVVADGSNVFFPGFLIVRGQTYSDGIGSFSGGNVGFALHITWSGNTVSWWSSNSIDIGTKYPQMNVENKTYRYVALG